MEEQNNQNFEERKIEQPKIEEARDANSAPTTPKKPFPKMVIGIIAVAVIAVAVLLIILLGGDKGGNITCESCGASISESVKFCPDCGNSVTSPDNNNNSNTTCQHSFGGWKTKVSANCTTGGTDERTCAKCAYKETKSTSALGHTTSTGICSRCNENFGGWEIRYYVDEFDRPTDEMYITNKEWIIGTFSNSATNDSLLKVKILIDNLDGPRVSIMLYEYGSNQVKSYYEATYNITLLDTNETKHSLKGIMYDGGDRVKLYVSYGGYDYISMMINALLQPGEISLYMVESKYTVNEYLFSVETSNFSEVYAELMGGDLNNSGKLDFTLNDDGQSYSVCGIGTYNSSNLVIPEEYNGKPVTGISDYAFEYNDTITTVTIPDSVINLGLGVFYGCSNLTNVSLGKGVSAIYSDVFAYCTSLKSISVPKDHPKYKSIDGNLYNKQGVLIQYAAGKSEKSFVIPDDVKEIAQCAFYGSYNLESITIGANVETISGTPFYECTALKNFIVSNNNQNYKSVNGNLYTKDGKTLVKYAIGKTESTFSIPNGVINIGECAFESSSYLTEIIIPKGVTNIGYYAFNYAYALESVTIPTSVTYIDYGAFIVCNSLTSINFKGTKSQWNAIEKAECWDEYTENYTVYCTDGNIAK